MNLRPERFSAPDDSESHRRIILKTSKENAQTGNRRGDTRDHWPEQDDLVAAIM